MNTDEQIKQLREVLERLAQAAQVYSGDVSVLIEARAVLKATAPKHPAEVGWVNYCRPIQCLSPKASPNRKKAYLAGFRDGMNHAATLVPQNKECLSELVRETILDAAAKIPSE